VTIIGGYLRTILIFWISENQSCHCFNLTWLFTAHRYLHVSPEKVRSRAYGLKSY